MQIAKFVRIFTRGIHVYEYIRECGSIITSDGPTNHWKKGTVNAALNSAAHFVGGNNFLNYSNNKLSQAISYMSCNKV